MSSLAKIVEGFSGKRIVVIGDIIADQFIHGEISRVSREAPVFILRHEHTETTPGGAGNCAANLAALGANVSLISVLGTDEPGQILLETLRKAGVDCDGVLLTDKRRTTTKVRVLAGQLHSTRQQVIRIDYDNEPGFSAELQDQLRASISEAVSRADAVIISDYNYGVADPRIAAVVRGAAGDRVPVLVDSRFRLSEFSDFTSATPNEDEVEQLLGVKQIDQAALELAAEQLRQQLGYKALLVTRGGHGMTLMEADSGPLHINAVGSSQPVDVTGAGDTVIATYALALASGSSFADAAHLANFAGGLVVMKRGTATISSVELVSAITQVAGE
ncbi:MAG: D-glycero-beta-D-manno-heptose-7-phosphate kinase [Blastocatellia bacterium]|jgi:rfaE bifunctional protein kinase chain/domain|nr:D-glycero-beta-D-manno-heptose-7-phosphate kinase [Blastocatellia bacterium]